MSARFLAGDGFDGVDTDPNPLMDPRTRHDPHDIFLGGRDYVSERLLEKRAKYSATPPEVKTSGPGINSTRKVVDR